MAVTKLDTLLDLLVVELEAFAKCEIDPGYSLACPPSDTIVVHFVLKGEGVLECEHGRFELRPGRLVLVPMNLPKRLNGPGPVSRLVDGTVCQLSPGLVKFQTSSGGSPGLVLGCGSIRVEIGGGVSPFDHLDAPLVEDCEKGPVPLLFEAMSLELRRPAAGTKAMVEALMKQIIVVLLRSHFSRSSASSPLQLLPSNAQLGRAVVALLGGPGEAHTVASLARIAGMSRSCFHRHFVSSYDCTPMEFLQTVRLRAAARMLTRSDMPVKSVAAAVGYASRSHFSRAFTAQFGSDPSRYRVSRDDVDCDLDPRATEPAAERLLA